MVIDLELLKKKALAATKGPWTYNAAGWVSWWNSANDGGEPDTDYLGMFDGANGPANAEYVSAADPTTVLCLIKRLELLEKTTSLQ